MLGVLHPDQLLASLTNKQWVEWIAYYQLQPFGDERADLRAGIVAALQYNTWRGKSDRRLDPLNFMPYTTKQPMTSDEIKGVLRGAIS